MREAPRHGALIATLDIMVLLPRLVPSLPGDQLVRFRLRGPKGLHLDYESPVAGQFHNQHFPVPVDFALLPGAELRLKLTGPPIVEAEALFALLSLPAAGMAVAGSLGKAEVSVAVSTADLDAVVAGKNVTWVFFLADRAQVDESPRVETLHSTQMAPPGDAVAEATRRGKILIVVKLGKELGALCP